MANPVICCDRYRYPYLSLYLESPYPCPQAVVITLNIGFLLVFVMSRSRDYYYEKGLIDVGGDAKHASAQHKERKIEKHW